MNNLGLKMWPIGSELICLFHWVDFVFLWRLDWMSLSFIHHDVNTDSNAIQFLVISLLAQKNYWIRDNWASFKQISLDSRKKYQCLVWALSLIVMRNKELILWPAKLDFRDSMQNNQKITCPFELESWFKFKRKYK